MDQPLAEKMRPKNLDQFMGQHHLVKDGEIIREIIKSGHPTSLIFWGPPGSGKTTLARIIASELEVDFVELSAVTASKKDILGVIERARINQNLSQATILFVDEIHRFSKSQQDTFLPHVESGLITLIGATTENPSFEVISPLLSRVRVLVLHPLDKQAMIKIIKRAAKSLKLGTKILPAKSIDLLAEISGGDARVALGNLDLALQLTSSTKVSEKITPEIVQIAAQKRVPSYDKGGQFHYNLVSAFIKSMRGSDTDATLYYLARMIEAGEDPKFVARRMIIFASEDIGLAGNGGVNLAVSTFLAVERLGMPESMYSLFHCATALSKSKKSRTVTNAMNNALKAAREYPDAQVPLHLRNAPTKLMKDLGYQKGTKWQAGFVHPEGFLPEEIKNLKIF